jgi:hypothetical protein
VDKTARDAQHQAQYPEHDKDDSDRPEDPGQSDYGIHPVVATGERIAASAGDRPIGAAATRRRSRASCESTTAAAWGPPLRAPSRAGQLRQHPRTRRNDREQRICFFSKRPEDGLDQPPVGDGVSAVKTSGLPVRRKQATDSRGYRACP